MLDKIRRIFADEGIFNVGMIPIDECVVINARILPPQAKSAVLFTIPYRSFTKPATDGFSEYARIYDYHKYASSLYERIIPSIISATGANASGFCDHSPINEKLAAAKCGLGIIGRNSLFIDKKYGSFVFLGSVMSEAVCTEPTHETEFCHDCGRCAEACPAKAIGERGIDPKICLSAISQRKTKTEEEKASLRKNRIVWGCDICQSVCPYNENAEVSPIPYFAETRIKHIDKPFVESLSDEEFNKYAFSYKGRKIVLDNVDNAGYNSDINC